MKLNKMPLLALIVWMSAIFLLPMSAYAAEDTIPPSVTARLDGDILRAEANDKNSGVEAVYVDGHRFSYLVDGAIEVDLEDCAGDGEHVTVYALDFAGNKSKEVKVNNPYYSAPSTSARTPATSAPAPAPKPIQSAPAATAAQTTQPAAATSQPPTVTSQAAQPAATSQPAATPSTSGSTPEPAAAGESETLVVGEAKPFTPPGTGSVQDNATDGDGKEFFTITTADEHVFYLVIDRQRDSDGVYLLNAVTEDDLMALAKKNVGESGVTAIPADDLHPEPEPELPASELEPDIEPEPEAEPAAPSNSGSNTFIFIVLAALVVGGAGYYFKILRPKRDAAAMTDDGDGDDYGEEGDGYIDEADGDYGEWDDDYPDEIPPEDDEQGYRQEDSEGETGDAE